MEPETPTSSMASSSESAARSTIEVCFGGADGTCRVAEELGPSRREPALPKSKESSASTFRSRVGGVSIIDAGNSGGPMDVALLGIEVDRTVSRGFAAIGVCGVGKSWGSETSVLLDEGNALESKDDGAPNVSSSVVVTCAASGVNLAGVLEDGFEGLPPDKRDDATPKPPSS
jgi:hypothetical protein